MEQIFIAVVAAASALVGSYLGPFMQRKQSAADATRADAALMRDKAEQIFEEIDKFLVASRNASLSAFRLLGPAELRDQTPAVPMADIGKIRALIATYYPNGLPLIEEFDAEVKRASDVVLGQIKAEQKKDGPKPDAIRGYTAMLAADRGVTDASLAKKLRDHLVAEVRQYVPLAKG